MTIASAQDFPVHTAILTRGDGYMNDEERIAPAACHIFHKQWVQHMNAFYAAGGIHTFRQLMMSVLKETNREIGAEADSSQGRIEDTAVTSMSSFEDLLSVSTSGDSMVYLVRANRIIQLDERSMAAKDFEIDLPTRADEHDEVGINTIYPELDIDTVESRYAVSLYQLEPGDFVFGWTKKVSTCDAEFLEAIVEELRQVDFTQQHLDKAVRAIGLYSLDTTEDLASVAVTGMWIPPKKLNTQNSRKAGKKEKKNGSK